jgi:thiol:disulfide interchange protein DsbD
MCLPPKDVDFTITVTPATVTPKPGTTPAETTPNTETKPGGLGQVDPNPSTTPVDGAGATATVADPNAPTTAATGDSDQKGTFSSKRNIDPTKFVGTCSSDVNEADGSFWITLFWGFIFGLGAVLTPCIFPMIPVTVGFFVKRSKDRATGLRNAFIYGLSIYLIYVALGVGITKALGPTALNEMSTNLWFNLLFFLVFIAFAISFFGFFEISLPASWVNKSDQMAGKGGILGIFFMAFTLALVSFSCTGPLVGSLLVETARSNNGQELLGFLPARPFAGLSGFGLALALPFALFAMFPGWLKSLPKSGGWM